MSKEGSGRLLSCCYMSPRVQMGSIYRVLIAYWQAFIGAVWAQGKFMKESYPRKWVLEPGHPQADGFCIFAGARFLAAVKCRIRFSVGWFWAAQSLVWT